MDLIEEENQDVDSSDENEEDLCINQGRKELLDKIKDIIPIEDESEKDSNVNSTEKRLSYLMAQSEVFSHFLMGDINDSVAAGNRGKKSSNANKKTALKTKTGRTRKNEITEDKELMKMAQKDANVTRLLKQPSNIVGGEMRAYQLEGLNWLIKLYDNNVNGILADEMGLGKTLQTISLLAYLLKFKQIRGPHIIIVPKSTEQSGFNDVSNTKTSSGDDKLRVVKLLGDKQSRSDLIKNYIKPRAFDIVVTSYECAIKEKGPLKRINWKYVVIDEAHRLKNENSLLSKITRCFKAEYRLLITGTPLQNNLHELWALLNFLMPEVFSSSTSFDTWFNTNDKASTDNVIKKLHTVLKPFMLRRIKQDVDSDIPPKIETKLYVGMSEMQKEWYVRVLKNDMASLNALGGPEKTKLMNVLMQLRKVCNHPYLFEGAEPGPPYIDGPHLYQNSGKMAMLAKLLVKLKQQDSRVLIFSQMTRMLDIIEDYMIYAGYLYARIDGQSDGETRDAAMAAFNAPKSPLFVMLLSTRAGGLGINLQTADIVILYDSDWNPQVDLQAQDRAHRIGQKKTVRVFRLITDETVDVKVIERAERKLFLDAAVIQQGRLAEKHGNSLSKNELMSMVKFGADEILKNKGGTITDEDIDKLLSAGEKRTEEETEKMKSEMAKHTLANFAINLDEIDRNAANSSVFDFEGENWKKKRKDGPDGLGDSGGLFINLPQREKKGRKSYDADSYFKELMGLPPGKSLASGASGVKTFKKKLYGYADYQFYDCERLNDISEREASVQTTRYIIQQVLRELKLRETKAKKMESNASSTADSLEDLKEDSFPLVIDILDQLNVAPESYEDVVNFLKAHRGKYRAIEDQNPNSIQLSSIISAEIEYIQALISESLLEVDNELIQEKEMLLEAGFKKITKSDYKIILECIEKYGLLEISEEDGTVKDKAIEHNLVSEICRLTGKQDQYIRKYVYVFNKRYMELADAKKIVEKAAKAEKRYKKEKFSRDAICYKANQLKQTLSFGSKYPNYKHINSLNYADYMPAHCQPNSSFAGNVKDRARENSSPESSKFLSNIDNSPTESNQTKEYMVPVLPACNTGILTYSSHHHRSRCFTEDEDIFLILMMYTHGYGSWEAIRGEIRYRPRPRPGPGAASGSSNGGPAFDMTNYRQLFQFDWYLKSRTTLDIQKRCEILLRMIEKEYERVLNKNQRADGGIGMTEPGLRPETMEMATELKVKQDPSESKSDTGTEVAEMEIDSDAAEGSADWTPAMSKSKTKSSAMLKSATKSNAKTQAHSESPIATLTSGRSSRSKRQKLS